MKRKEQSLHNKSSTLVQWLPFLFFLFAFFIYANTFENQYAVDDPLYTTHNAFVQKGISSFPDLVSKGSLAGYNETSIADYRPLVLITFALEKSLFGNSTKSNHFFNVVLYSLLCTLLFFFLSKLFAGYPVYVPALFIALFTVHPLHTEVVANIKSRDEILCMLFGIAALHTVIKYSQTNNIRSLIYSCVFFFLCLVSKENGYTYLGLLPLVLYFFTNSTFKRIAILTLPFIAVATITIFIRIGVLDSFSFDKPLPILDNSLIAATTKADELATVFTMLLHALWLLFFPVTLSWDYSYNHFPIVGWSNYKAILSLAIHIGLVGIAITGFRKKTVFSFAILFYLISYFITSNLVIKIGSSFAERFLFAPSLAFCIAFPFLLAKVFRINLKTDSFAVAGKIIAVLAMVFLLYSYRTIDRNQDWENNMTISTSGLGTCPNSARAHIAYAFNLAIKAKESSTRERRNEYAQAALTEYQKSNEIYPNVATTYYEMGVIYYSIGDTDNAIKMYKKTLSITPDFDKALNNLGIISFLNNDYNAALDYFKRAALSNPKHAKALAGVGACYLKLNDDEKAITYYKKSLLLDSANTGTLQTLSLLYANLGDTLNAKYYSARVGLY